MDTVYCKDCGTVSVHKGRSSCAVCGFDGKGDESNWYSHLEADE